MWYKIAVALVVVQGIHAGNDMNSVESQYGHELQWYSTKQACDLLRNYRTIHVVGDSTSRRLAYTLRALLVGWPEASLRSDDRYGDRGGQDSWAKLNRTLGTVLARLSQVLPDRVKGKKMVAKCEATCIRAIAAGSIAARPRGAARSMHCRCCGKSHGPHVRDSQRLRCKLA